MLKPCFHTSCTQSSDACGVFISIKLCHKCWRSIAAYALPVGNSSGSGRREFAIKMPKNFCAMCENTKTMSHDPSKLGSGQRKCCYND